MQQARETLVAETVNGSIAGPDAVFEISGNGKLADREMAVTYLVP
jgi:hypothetical protein